MDDFYIDVAAIKPDTSTSFDQPFFPNLSSYNNNNNSNYSSNNVDTLPSSSSSCLNNNPTYCPSANITSTYTPFYNSFAGVPPVESSANFCAQQLPHANSFKMHIGVSLASSPPLSANRRYINEPALPPLSTPPTPPPPPPPPPPPSCSSSATFPRNVYHLNANDKQFAYSSGGDFQATLNLESSSEEEVKEEEKKNKQTKNIEKIREINESQTNFGTIGGRLWNELRSKGEAFDKRRRYGKEAARATKSINITHEGKTRGYPVEHEIEPGELFSFAEECAFFDALKTKEKNDSFAGCREGEDQAYDALAMRTKKNNCETASKTFCSFDSTENKSMTNEKANNFSYTATDSSSDDENAGLWDNICDIVGEEKKISQDSTSSFLGSKNMADRLHNLIKGKNKKARKLRSQAAYDCYFPYENHTSSAFDTECATENNTKEFTYSGEDDKNNSQINKGFDKCLPFEEEEEKKEGRPFEKEKQIVTKNINRTQYKIPEGFGRDKRSGTNNYVKQKECNNEKIQEKNGNKEKIKEKETKLTTNYASVDLNEKIRSRSEQRKNSLINLLQASNDTESKRRPSNEKVQNKINRKGPKNGNRSKSDRNVTNANGKNVEKHNFQKFFEKLHSTSSYNSFSCEEREEREEEEEEQEEDHVEEEAANNVSKRNRKKDVTNLNNVYANNHNSNSNNNNNDECSYVPVRPYISTYSPYPPIASANPYTPPASLGVRVDAANMHFSSHANFTSTTASHGRASSVSAHRTLPCFSAEGKNKSSNGNNNNNNNIRYSYSFGPPTRPPSASFSSPEISKWLRRVADSMDAKLHSTEQYLATLEENKINAENQIIHLRNTISHLEEQIKMHRAEITQAEEEREEAANSFYKILKEYEEYKQNVLSTTTSIATEKQRTIVEENAKLVIKLDIAAEKNKQFQEKIEKITLYAKQLESKLGIPGVNIEGNFSSSSTIQEKSSNSNVDNEKFNSNAAAYSALHSPDLSNVANTAALRKTYSSPIANFDSSSRGVCTLQRTEAPLAPTENSNMQGTKNTVSAISSSIDNSGRAPAYTTGCDEIPAHIVQLVHDRLCKYCFNDIQNEGSFNCNNRATYLLGVHNHSEAMNANYNNNNAKEKVWLTELLKAIKAWPNVSNHPTILWSFEAAMQREGAAVEEKKRLLAIDSEYEKLGSSRLTEIAIEQLRHKVDDKGNLLILEEEYACAVVKNMHLNNIYNLLCTAVVHNSKRWLRIIRDTLFAQFTNLQFNTPDLMPGKVRSPLCWCISSKRGEMMDYLLALNNRGQLINLTATDPYSGRNAWHYAFASNDERLLFRLRNSIQFPEGLNCCDKWGHLPYTLADNQACCEFKHQIVLYYAQIGSDKYREGVHEAAYDYFNRALSIQQELHKDESSLMRSAENTSKLLYNKARALLHMNKWKEAIECCRKCRELLPDYTNAYETEAAAFEQLLDWQEAYNIYDKMISMFGRGLPKYTDTLEKKEQAKCQIDATPYEILGVKRCATTPEIKKAFKKLVLQWHPDKVNTATDDMKARTEIHFKRISKAMQILTDPEQRRIEDLKSVRISMYTYKPPTVIPLSSSSSASGAYKQNNNENNKDNDSARIPHNESFLSPNKARRNAPHTQKKMNNNHSSSPSSYNHNTGRKEEEETKGKEENEFVHMNRQECLQMKQQLQKSICFLKSELKAKKKEATEAEEKDKTGKTLSTFHQREVLAEINKLNLQINKKTQKLNRLNTFIFNNFRHDDNEEKEEEEKEEEEEEEEKKRKDEKKQKEIEEEKENYDISKEEKQEDINEKRERKEDKNESKDDRHEQCYYNQHEEYKIGESEETKSAYNFYDNSDNTDEEENKNEVSGDQEEQEEEKEKNTVDGNSYDNTNSDNRNNSNSDDSNSADNNNSDDKSNSSNDSAYESEDKNDKDSSETSNDDENHAVNLSDGNLLTGSANEEKEKDSYDACKNLSNTNTIKKSVNNERKLERKEEKKERDLYGDSNVFDCKDDYMVRKKHNVLTEETRGTISSFSSSSASSVLFGWAVGGDISSSVPSLSFSSSSCPSSTCRYSPNAYNRTPTNNKKEKKEKNMEEEKKDNFCEGDDLHKSFSSFHIDSSSFRPKTTSTRTDNANITVGENKNRKETEKKQNTKGESDCNNYAQRCKQKEESAKKNDLSVNEKKRTVGNNNENYINNNNNNNKTPYSFLDDFQANVTASTQNRKIAGVTEPSFLFTSSFSSPFRCAYPFELQSDENEEMLVKENNEDSGSKEDEKDVSHNDDEDDDGGDVEGCSTPSQRDTSNERPAGQDTYNTDVQQKEKEEEEEKEKKSGGRVERKNIASKSIFNLNRYQTFPQADIFKDGNVKENNAFIAKEECASSSSSFFSNEKISGNNNNTSASLTFSPSSLFPPFPDSSPSASSSSSSSSIENLSLKFFNQKNDNEVPLLNFTPEISPRGSLSPRKSAYDISSSVPSSFSSFCVDRKAMEKISAANNLRRCGGKVNVAKELKNACKSFNAGGGVSPPIGSKKEKTLFAPPSSSFPIRTNKESNNNNANDRSPLPAFSCASSSFSPSSFFKEYAKRPSVEQSSPSNKYINNNNSNHTANTPCRFLNEDKHKQKEKANKRKCNVRNFETKDLLQEEMTKHKEKNKPEKLKCNDVNESFVEKSYNQQRGVCTHKSSSFSFSSYNSDENKRNSENNQDPDNDANEKDTQRTNFLFSLLNKNPYTSSSFSTSPSFSYSSSFMRNVNFRRNNNNNNNSDSNNAIFNSASLFDGRGRIAEDAEHVIDTDDESNEKTIQRNKNKKKGVEEERNEDNENNNNNEDNKNDVYKTHNSNNNDDIINDTGNTNEGTVEDIYDGEEGKENQEKKKELEKLINEKQFLWKEEDAYKMQTDGTFGMQDKNHGKNSNNTYVDFDYTNYKLHNDSRNSVLFSDKSKKCTRNEDISSSSKQKKNVANYLRTNTNCVYSSSSFSSSYSNRPTSHSCSAYNNDNNSNNNSDDTSSSSPPASPSSIDINNEDNYNCDNGTDYNIDANNDKNVEEEEKEEGSSGNSNHSDQNNNKNFNDSTDTLNSPSLNINSREHLNRKSHSNIPPLRFDQLSSFCCASSASSSVLSPSPSLSFPHSIFSSSPLATSPPSPSPPSSSGLSALSARLGRHRLSAQL